MGTTDGDVESASIQKHFAKGSKSIYLLSHSRNSRQKPDDAEPFDILNTNVSYPNVHFILFIVQLSRRQQCLYNGWVVTKVTKCRLSVTSEQCSSFVREIYPPPHPTPRKQQGEQEAEVVEVRGLFISP